MKSLKSLFVSRRFRQGSLATAITAAVCAIVVVLNAAATVLTDRYGLTLDLTPTKLLSLTDETKTFLGELDRDVTIAVMSREEVFAGGDQYYLQANEVLKRYALESDRVHLQYRDLLQNPAIAQEYPDLQLDAASIVVQCGDRARDISPYELYDIEYDYYGYGYITASRAEQVLTGAIAAVVSENTVSVAVLTGHNEESIAGLTDLLTRNNYFVDTVNLVTQEIDSAYDLAILGGPQLDFTEEELRRLDRFLEQEGKTLLYFASAQQTDMPVFDAFLADWGIEMGEGLVLETDPRMRDSRNPFISVVNYAEGEYAAGVIAKQMLTLTANARPLTLWETGGVMTATLLEFPESAGIIDADTQSADSVEPVGPIPYLVYARSAASGGTSGVMAAGSTALINVELLSQANIGNGDYILDLTGGITGKEETVHIQQKAIGNRQLGISEMQAILLGFVLIVVFPLLLLIFGIAVWLRRRHR